MQLYGGAAFASVRDKADDIFSNLPAPVPQGRMSGFGGGHGGSGHAAPAPALGSYGSGGPQFVPASVSALSMRSFNNRDAGEMSSHLDFLLDCSLS